ncbi:MAG: hypothetical protein JWP06_37 [Candidatus Saccharibacteria bacterium]|nr:hypothetical protein [Candidatus Saccharibacteria bacterium]
MTCAELGVQRLRDRLTLLVVVEEFLITGVDVRGLGERAVVLANTAGDLAH